MHFFDDVSSGYDHARFMGRVVSGGVLRIYDKVKYVDVDTVKYKQRTIYVPTNKFSDEDLQEAHRICELHQMGRDAEIPYIGMMLNSMMAAFVRLSSGVLVDCVYSAGSSHCYSGTL